jgi:hypothetical protein
MGGVVAGRERCLDGDESSAPYDVRASGHAPGLIEAWSGYPLQFSGQRRFSWQDEMAAELRDALAGLAVTPSDVLSGMYLSTSESRCDVENRLFTNPGTSVFPKTVRTCSPPCRCRKNR